MSWSPVAIRLEPWAPPARHVRRVVLKLRRAQAALLPAFGDLTGRLQDLGVPLADLAASHPLGPSRRVYRGDDDRVPKLNAMVLSRFEKDPELETYIRIPAGREAEAFAKAVIARAPQVIERAFVESDPTPPPGGGLVGFPYAGQSYLQPSPGGIGARDLWVANADGTFLNTGAGVTIADVEESWDLTHAELPAGIPIDGWNRPGATHGTMILGLLGAQENSSGCRGIAFESELRAVSLFQYDDVGVDYFSRADAIRAARQALKDGDVMLLETQMDSKGKYVPAECDELVRIEIQAATASGITVVEAAGNDSEDLGKHLDDEDSGAILVAAAASTPTGWVAMGNHGARVNCFAQGTLATTIDPANASKTSAIGQTSAATAIVAGAAALIQSWAKRVRGGPLTTKGLRDKLSDPAFNTASARGKSIGVMPNVIAIRDHLLTQVGVPI